MLNTLETQQNKKERFKFVYISTDSPLRDESEHKIDGIHWGSITRSAQHTYTAVLNHY